MSYILHLETSTKVCSVALSQAGNLLAFKESQTDAFEHGENLTCFIEDVMQQIGIKFSQLAAISVASGPGSYTGLRIGVSTAKGLCFGLSIPLIAIDSLRSMAELSRQVYPTEVLCPMIDARRMEVYSAIYDQHNNVLKPISADILDESSYIAFGPMICFGDGSSKVSSLWSNREVVFDSTIHASARGQVRLAYQKFVAGEFEDVAYFEPYYLKDFVTTQKRN
jgi:tRNA threonylcarbamoyladenosine biosynthesis protein TsaB